MVGHEPQLQPSRPWEHPHPTWTTGLQQVMALAPEMAEAILGMDEIIDPVLRSMTSGRLTTNLAVKLRAIGGAS